MNKQLLLAARMNNLNNLKSLLAHGSHVHTHGDEALLMATRNKTIDAVTLLLANGADVHAEDDQALFNAINNKDTPMLELLLKRVKKVGGKPQIHRESLYGAVMSGHLPTIRLLIDRGFDVEEKSHPAFVLAVERQWIEALELLLCSGFPLEEGIRVAQNNRVYPVADWLKSLQRIREERAFLQEAAGAVPFSEKPKPRM